MTVAQALRSHAEDGINEITIKNHLLAGASMLEQFERENAILCGLLQGLWRHDPQLTVAEALSMPKDKLATYGMDSLASRTRAAAAPFVNRRSALPLEQAIIEANKIKA